MLREQRLAKQKRMGIVEGDSEFPPRDEGARPWDDLNEKQKRQLDYRMAVYCAMVDRMDQNIGRVIEQLELSCELDNTLLVFLSGNGGCAEPYTDLGGGMFDQINSRTAMGAISYGQGWANASNTPFRKFKVYSHEGGISTPLIVHWPEGLKLQDGAITDQPAQLIDLMPTFLDAAGAEYPETLAGKKIHPLEGVSLLPLLEGGERKPAEWMYWEHEGHSAVRHGEFKALRPKGSKGWKLYDLSVDRQETNDLASGMPYKTQAMAEKWEAWARSHNVK